MVTQEDVARECGISVTTVSRVMNKRGYISKETYEKVYAAMRKLNYAPNEIARSLSKNNTDTIGVILPHIDHPYFSKLLHYLEKAAVKNGQKLMIFSTHRNADVEEECIEKCRAGRMDGIILCAGNIQTLRLSEMNIPMITLERDLDSATSCVLCDNEEGGRLAARHLLSRGCKKVLYIGSLKDTSMPADLRYRGFEEICGANGIWCKEIKNQDIIYEELSYYGLIEEILDEYPDVDGIFASSDVIAAQVLRVARKRKIDIPDKLKVIGFDDTRISALTTPQLTTIHQPVEEMAKKAISLLMSIKNGASVAGQTILPVCLIEREST